MRRLEYTKPWIEPGYEQPWISFWEEGSRDRTEDYGRKCQVCLSRLGHYLLGAGPVEITEAYDCWKPMAFLYDLETPEDCRRVLEETEGRFLSCMPEGSKVFGKLGGGKTNGSGRISQGSSPRTTTLPW